MPLILSHPMASLTYSIAHSKALLRAVGTAAPISVGGYFKLKSSSAYLELFRQTDQVFYYHEIQPSTLATHCRCLGNATKPLAAEIRYPDLARGRDFCYTCENSVLYIKQGLCIIYLAEPIPGNK
jgi:hypothetical protein